MILHFSNLTLSQQTNVVLELMDIYEEWEITNSRDEFHEDRFYLIESETVH